MEIIAQIISIVAMIVSIFAMQFKTNRSMFICRGVSGFLFSLSYFLLGAYTGAALNLINLLRSILVINKKTQGRSFMALIIAIYATATFLTFGGYLSILVLLAQSAESFFMWGRNGKHIRYCQLFFVSPIWLFYNIMSFSIGGILAEVFVIVSTIVSFIRFRKTGFDKT